ncbi:hypothetical protein Taro_053707 [Colocasia esculenta]|uniref:Uncharacterized protein n=1 Tax=Colocasia esculenta TaxID=4460 RepID=A0A843XND1_COLES|nr:hypothetical protein [Colocasia esculenta]
MNVSTHNGLVSTPLSSSVLNGFCEQMLCRHMMLAMTLRLILQTSGVSSFNFSIFIIFIAYVNTIVTLVMV